MSNWHPWKQFRRFESRIYRHRVKLLAGFQMALFSVLLVLRTQYAAVLVPGILGLFVWLETRRGGPGSSATPPPLGNCK